MSTRCQLKIWIKNDKESNYDLKYSLYHHCDGYPYWPESAKENGTGGMLEDIKTVLNQLTTTNGLEEKLDNYFNDIEPQYEIEDEYCLHGDLDYVYHLYLNFKNVGNLRRLDDALLMYAKLGLDCKDYDRMIMEPKQSELEFGWHLFYSDEGTVKEEEIQLELETETIKALTEKAKELNMSVNDYVSKILKAAIKTGEFETIVKNIN